MVLRRREDRVTSAAWRTEIKQSSREGAIYGPRIFDEMGVERTEEGEVLDLFAGKDI